jgi:hypothetical protein
MMPYSVRDPVCGQVAFQVVNDRTFFVNGPMLQARDFATPEGSPINGGDVAKCFGCGRKVVVFANDIGRLIIRANPFQRE